MNDLFRNGQNMLRTMFVTNNNIATEILARGYFMPFECIQKYYQDLLHLTPGSIPLFKSEIINSEFAKYCAESDPYTLYPIVFELEFENDIYSNTDISDQKIGHEYINDSIILVSGIIPTSTVKRIIFSNEEDHKRFLYFIDKKISNIPVDFYKYEVKNILNKDDKYSFEKYKEKVKYITSENKINDYKLTSESKIAAGLLTIRKIFKKNQYDPILKEIIIGLTNNLGKIALVYGVNASSDWTDINIRNAASGNSDIKTTEGTLFSKFIEIIAEINPLKGFVIDNVADKLVEEISGDVSKQDLIYVKEDLERIKNVFMSLENINDVYKSCHYVMTKVILFFSKYHNDLNEFVSHERKRNDYDQELQILTGFLLGFYYGSDLLPREFKDKELETFITNSTTNVVNSDVPGSIIMSFDKSKVIKETIEIIKKMPIKSRLLFFFKKEEHYDEEKLRKALEVAELLEISDCIKTEILVKDRDVCISNSKGSRGNVIKIRVEGQVDVKQELDKEKFISSLSQIKIKRTWLKKVAEVIEG